MAALRMREGEAGRLTLQSPVLPQVGNIFSMLVWLAVLAFFILPAFGNDRVDWSNLLMIGFFFLVTVGGSVVGSLPRTTITVDPANREVTSSRQFLGFPLQSTALSFNELTAIETEYYRQSSGRYSHDAWRVLAVARDGRRLLLNWDGKLDEMTDLATQLSNRTGAPLVDNSAKPVSTVQQILGRMKGEGGQAPEAEGPQSVPEAADSTAVPALPQASLPAPSEVQPSNTMEPRFTDIPSAVPDSSLPDREPRVWDLSARELEQRISSDSLDSDARHALGRKYQAGGQLDRAIELYQKAMALDPANPGIQNDLGVALAQQGRRGEAEKAFRRAIALDPFSSTAHLNLGLILRSLKRASEASQEFYQARQNARRDAETRAAEAASTGGKIEPQLSSL